MIKARPGHVACFLYDPNSSSERTRSVYISSPAVEEPIKTARGLSRDPVLAWDDEGYPMVLRDGRLARAQGRYFVGVDEEPVVVQLIPATEWLTWDLWTPPGGEPQAMSQPLVAWALLGDGSIRPALTDVNGGVDIPGLNCLEHHVFLTHKDDEPPTVAQLQAELDHHKSLLSSQDVEEDHEDCHR